LPITTVPTSGLADSLVEALSLTAVVDSYQDKDLKKYKKIQESLTSAWRTLRDVSCLGDG